MTSKALQSILILSLSLLMATPTYARGGFGGGGGRSFGGGGFGGGRSFGGGGHDFGGFGGRSSRDFSGGFGSMGGGSRDFNRSGMGNQGFDRGNMGSQGFDRGNFGNQGFNRGNMGNQGFDRGNMGNQGFNRPTQPISSRPNFPNRGAGDGGFGGISGLQNRNPQKINNTQLKNQGQNVRNSFNNNQINHNNQFNNVNNYNVNRYGGYGGYGHYGSGYAHGWAASNAYHGYWGGAGCWGWGYPGWSQAYMWTSLGLSSLSTFLGLGIMGAELSNSNHSNNNYPQSVSNVTYQGDTVYVNGQPYGSSTQYYNQAQQLAAQAYAQGQADALAQQNAGMPPLAPNTVSTGGQSASNESQEKWAPLGVFSLAEPGETQANMLLQLAINPDGIVRGNYLNQLTNERSQIYGALDKKTQRVSFTIGENNSTVFDTTLRDLTREDSQILVHYGATNTQEMALIRLPAPKDGDGASASPDDNPEKTPAAGS